MQIKKMYFFLIFCFLCTFNCFGTEEEFPCVNIEVISSEYKEIGGGNSKINIDSFNSKNEKVFVKIFGYFNDDQFLREKNICEKIYKYNKKNKISSNLLKVFGSAKFPCDPERNGLIFEKIDGIPLDEWKQNHKFYDSNDFINNFCLPLIFAFKEYYKITGQLKNATVLSNIIMRKKGNNWEPVITDYGSNSAGCNFWLINTILSCCDYVEKRDIKLQLLYGLFSKNLDVRDNITVIDKILDQLLKIKNKEI